MASHWLRRGVALLVLAVMLATVPQARAQAADDLAALQEQVSQLHSQGQYTEALPLAERYVALARQLHGEEAIEFAAAIAQLGQVYRAQGRDADAEPLYQRALAITEKALGPDHPDVGTHLRNLGELYRAQGRDAEAAPLIKRARIIAITAAFDQMPFGLHSDPGENLNKLARRYAAQGRYAEAERLDLQALDMAQKALGPDHADVGTRLNNLAEVYRLQSRYAEAEPLYLRALAITEKALGPDHADVGTRLGNLAELYRVQGRYAEAEPLDLRALAITEKALGPDHADVATSLNNLAVLYDDQGRYTEAEPLYQRALAITEKALGPEDRSVGTSLNNLALLYRDQGRYAEAEPLFKRALAITEKTLGSDHPTVGASLNNLALLYRDQGHYAEAEQLDLRALAIAEKALGPDHPEVGISLLNLGGIYVAQGRYAETEPLFKRALSITEKALGPNHPSVGNRLNNLAMLYDAQGRYAEAEQLDLRAIAITEKAHGPEHPNVATTLNNLGRLYDSQDRYAEAEPLYLRALAITEKARGPGHPSVGTSLNNLALLYREQGRYADAEPLLQRTLSIFEKALGSEHPDVAAALGNLAGLYRAQGRYPEAELLFTRALSIQEKALGPDHPSIGATLGNLGGLAFVRSDWQRSADYWRRSTSVTLAHAQRGTDDVGQALTGRRKGEAERMRYRFVGHVKAVHELAMERHAAEADYARETFQIAQWTSDSEAARSLAKMAVRAATGDPGLGLLVRERQDLVGEWQTHDQARSAAVARAPDKRNRAAEAANVDRLAAIDTRIADIDKQVTKDFRDYTALARPQPLSIEQVQAELRADEALVLFLDTPEWLPTAEETFIWVVTKTGMRWVNSGLGTQALTERVSALRCGLDYTLWNSLVSADKCRNMLGAALTEEVVSDQKVQVLPFDLGRAHDLFKALLGPVEDMIKGKHLLIVPSGPLTSLPFGVLVTEQPKSAISAKLADFRDVGWLGARQPITVLPSVSSLQALRQFARASHATKPYLGIGNPLLDGTQEDPQFGAYYKKLAEAALSKQQCPKAFTQHIALAAVRPLTDFANLFRGANADIEQVRQWTPLPETADELCEVGRRLGVPESEILLGNRATETVLKDLSDGGRLAQYAVLHFATHGALTGQVHGSAEPGLILTPPPAGTTDRKALERDDGFLTASEIASLKLDADWVILSACNTAGSSGETAEALSGIARAFFYAGARALLVSHWEVGSDAAVKLTTRAMAALKANQKIGRAEAFRISMLDLIQNGTATEAHPSLWAPFVVVGEGAAQK
jgi:tetratricopeptide (TPR) repeat protein/CHAT domain-containing protein